ncbi:hypothetical protein SALB1_1377 [Salinisphaera sp. LB1]|nr:hypothetical protein SALB1_1377 [Salinisphaera sp. LB1]
MGWELSCPESPVQQTHYKGRFRATSPAPIQGPGRTLMHHDKAESAPKKSRAILVHYYGA